MAANAVTDISTGAVIKWGYVDFTGDYDTDEQIQVALNDGATPVADVPLYYQKIVSGEFVEMTSTEKEAVDDEGISPEDAHEFLSLGAFASYKLDTENYDSWYTCLTTGGDLQDGVLAANTLYALPLDLGANFRINRAGIRVTSGSAGYLRYGIYKDTDGLPSRLLIDFGEFDVTASGRYKWSDSHKLREGRKWLAVLTDATPTVLCINPNYIIPVLGFSSGLDPTPRYGFQASYTYGPLPADFPATPDFIEAAPLPAVFLRFKNTYIR